MQQLNNCEQLTQAEAHGPKIKVRLWPGQEIRQEPSGTNSTHHISWSRDGARVASTARCQDTYTDAAVQMDYFKNCDGMSSHGQNRLADTMNATRVPA